MGLLCPSRMCGICPSLNCCHYSHSAARPHDKSNARWMTLLHSTAPKTKLKSLKIPASHDSCTYSIPSWIPFSSVGQTQRLNLYQQLNHGVRYFDIRVGVKGEDPEKVYIQHGLCKGNKLSDNLSQVRKFLDENPGEFVAIRIKEEWEGKTAFRGE